jgi:hypothetical protein
VARAAGGDTLIRMQASYDLRVARAHEARIHVKALAA